MKRSKYYDLRLPERGAREGEADDAADVEDLTGDLVVIDGELERQRLEDVRLDGDKAGKKELAAHAGAAVLAHPDGSVTDAKLGERTVLTSRGTLQALLTLVGQAIQAVSGAASWNGAPATSLAAAKGHMDSRANPHGVTKSQVGLGSVDNTADADKPVSTAQAAAVAAVQAEVDKNTAARHSHANKSVLDGITAALVTAWNAASTHVGDAVKHITAAERTAWNAASTHVSDAVKHVTAAERTAWNAASTHVSDAVKHVTAAERTAWNAAVPQTRKVNGKALSADIALTAADIGAATAAQGAKADGAMAKSDYDADGDGVVDNALKVDGHTVAADVPAGAKFTDTNTWVALKGATTGAAGTAGYAPAPAAGAANRYLRSDGTWTVPPDTDTKYTHPGYTARSSGLYKVTVDASGHVSGAAAVTKADITALGIPGQDTNTTYSDMTAATASAAGAHGLVPAPAAGAQGKYLRGDGTWQTPPDTNTVYTHPTTAGNKHIPAGGASGQILRWSADGTAAWGSDTNTTYSDMTAATASAAGTHGLVPAPAAGAQGKYLRGDGTWAAPPAQTAMDGGTY